MSMIGNDIVDRELAAVQSNWQRQGWLEKLFTPTEQQYIQTAADPELTVWILWSRKEAAYKIYHRQTQIRAFNPKYFHCDISGNPIGKVVIGKRSYYVKTELTSEYVYSIAVTQKNDFDRIEEIELDAVKMDSKGIPFEKCRKLAVSKTHHGRFEKVVALNRQIEP